MLRVLAILLAAMLACPALGRAQTGTATTSVEPFKVGTFSSGAAPWVGIVLRDRFVVDLAQANAAMEKSRSYPRRAMPADMVASSPITKTASKAASTRSRTTSSRATRSRAPGLPTYARSLR